MRHFLFTCFFILSTFFFKSFAQGYYEAEIDGLYYRLYENGEYKNEATLARHPEKLYTGDIIIPDEVVYNNQKFIVTRIDAYTFNNCDIASVRFPNYCTEIDNYAFSECHELISITIPPSVTYIGEKAFFNCLSLETIHLPETEIQYGYLVFYTSSDNTGKENLKYIFTERDTPQEVSSNSIFSDFTLQNKILVVPDGSLPVYKSQMTYWYNFVNIIEYSDYIRTKDDYIEFLTLKKYSYERLYVGSTLTLQPTVFSKGNDYTINYSSDNTDCCTVDNNGIVTIHSGGFCTIKVTCHDKYKDCTILVTDSLTAYIDGVFYQISDVENGKASVIGTKKEMCDVIIRNYVTINGREFPVTSLQKSWYTLHSLNPIGGSATGSTRPLPTPKNEYITRVILPETFESFDDGSFDGVPNLKVCYYNKTLPSRYIGLLPYSKREQYYGEIQIDTDLIYTTSGELLIAPYTYDNSNYTYTIPSVIKKIRSYAFYALDSLYVLNIPASVEELESNPIINCPNLTEININDSSDTIHLGKLCFNPQLSKLHVGRSVTCESPILENTQLVDVSFGPNVQTISSLFNGCTSIKEITLPNSIREIDSYAFGGCSALQKIKLPDNLVSVGSYAFCGCTELSDINLSNSITTIGMHAFEGCSSLTEITLPNSLRSIEQYTFNFCTSLNNISLPPSVTTIGQYAFKSCDALTTMLIPGHVTSIGSSILYDCYNLKEVYWYSACIPIGEIPAEKIYTFRDTYSGDNAVLLDFLQPNHLTALKTGLKIDYSSRFKDFDVEGYKLNSLQILGDDLDGKPNTDMDYDVIDVELRDDGKYVIPIQNVLDNMYGYGYNVSLTYYDPRAERNVRTTFYGFKTDNNLLSYNTSEITCSKVSFDFKFTKDESFEIEEVTFRNTRNDNSTYSFKKDGNVTFENIPLDYVFQPECIVKCKDGRTIFTNVPYFHTKGITFAEPNSILTPTSISLSWDYNAGDAESQIAETYIELTPGYEMSVIKNAPTSKVLISLPIQSTINVAIIARTIDGRIFKDEKRYTLPPLVLNVKEANAISNDCAIICAETNVADEEIGCGFEWRRYDAPDMVPSTFVKCSVSDYIMAGKLKGLSPNTYYKYRPFYEDCNGNRTFGEWIAFGTADAYVYFEPIVRTYQPSDITETSATIVGYALEGSDNIIEQGFEYWISQTQSRSASNIQRVQCSGERMVATIADLIPGYTYSIRAYAKTSKETTYGEEQLFTTITPEEIDEDSINEVTTTSEAFDIYTITGVCVRRKATSFNGLQPGIYIANGRKYFIR